MVGEEEVSQLAARSSQLAAPQFALQHGRSLIRGASIHPRARRSTQLAVPDIFIREACAAGMASALTRLVGRHGLASTHLAPALQHEERASGTDTVKPSSWHRPGCCITVDPLRQVRSLLRAIILIELVAARSSLCRGRRRR